jgi:membrane protein YqaA with SNARE-associated domain
MFDWLRTIARKLSHFIISVPIYYAAPAMFFIGALDSSLLSLPEINDYLVVMRCYRDPRTVFIFPAFAAAGSVAGCFLLYTIIRRGEQAILRRRFRARDIERVERAYARFGFLALAVPALLPPPMPFKIFVATAGAMEYKRSRFLIIILCARSLRYYVEGILAVYYGERVLRFLEHNGWLIVSAVAALVLLGLIVYFFIVRRRNPLKNSPPIESETDARAATSGAPINEAQASAATNER